ncbi:FliH/SctL family protein [Limnochorda pilosa]|uniref:Flagellar assembly protein FliH/Type III secretion system HrpE domain-containing protein n=1 Tax=Limnochorda pilosa TaxID=1555112 RepID=A0A0K2SKW8_LIMPI|nr:FliH/SctL family protein [Limnochorda pilosa]BAS27499.1 hypothetical protein LIP_1653 [Limnochorda pilosa]
MSRIIKAALVAAVVEPEPAPRARDLATAETPSDYLVDAARVLEAAQAQADRLMGSARERVVELVEEVERRTAERVDRARREAEESGFEEGVRQGRAQGLDEAREVLHRLEGLVDRVVRLREELLARHEEDVVKLSLAVAEKVIGRVVEEDREVAARTVRQLLNQVAGATEIRIRIHPDDLPAVRAHEEEWKRLAEGSRSLALLPDDRVAPGGALVETEFGAIDGGIEGRFVEVSQTLMEVLRGEA